MRTHAKFWGLCTSCLKDPTGPSRTKCEKCAEYKKVYNRSPENKEKDIKRRALRRETNRCITCGAPLHMSTDKDHVKCVNCRSSIFNRLVSVARCS